MKRSKPLKRTPLKRSRKPIRKRSKKRSEKDRRFKAGPKPDQCEICEANRRLEADHVLQRSTWPQYVGEPLNCMWICRPCHSMVTNDPHVKYFKIEDGKLEETLEIIKSERIAYYRRKYGNNG